MILANVRYRVRWGSSNSRQKRARILTECRRASDGKKVENTKVVGLVKDIGASKAHAWREVGHLGLDKNINQSSRCKPTFGDCLNISGGMN